MMPGTAARGSSDPARLGIGHAGNVCQVVSVDNQTINLGHKPEWTQALDGLKVAEQRLYRAGLRYEARAVLPVMASALMTMLAMWILFKFAVGYLDFESAAVKLVILAAGAVLGLQVWFGLCDIRRRHRAAVKAAERRCAEVTIEIALQTETTPKPPPMVWLIDFFNARLSRRGTQNGHE